MKELTPLVSFSYDTLHIESLNTSVICIKNESTFFFQNNMIIRKVLFSAEEDQHVRNISVEKVINGKEQINGVICDSYQLELEVLNTFMGNVTNENLLVREYVVESEISKNIPDQVWYRLPHISSRRYSKNKIIYKSIECAPDCDNSLLLHEILSISGAGKFNILENSAIAKCAY